MYSELTKMEGKRIVIRTFGYFDIFVDGETIPFSCKKAKELLALLVDRRGGFVTTGDAISYLWEDECTEKRIKDKFRKVVKELRRTLNAYGIERVLHRVNQESRIRTEHVECDLYDYLEDEEKHKKLFKGVYMTNYSWAENNFGNVVESKRIMGNIAKIGRLLSDSLPIFLKRFYWTTHSLYSFLIVNVCCKRNKN